MDVRFLKRFFPTLAVCLGCIVALSPLRKAPLLYDDTSIVGKDPFVMAMWADNGEEADLLNGLWFQPRPVRILTHRLDALVFGDTTAGPHIENIAFHIVIGLLLLSLLRTIGVSRGVSLGAMTLFLLHPVCIESVGILSHRKELLSALWLLAALRLSLSGSAGCGMAAVVALSSPCFRKRRRPCFRLFGF